MTQSLVLKHDPGEPGSLSGKKPPFIIMIAPDEMAAYIPAGKPVSFEIAQITYEWICAYFQKLGFVSVPSPQTFEILRQAAATPPHFFAKNFVVCRGKPAIPAQKGKVSWLNRSNQPKDLIFPGVPFATITQPAGPIAPISVFGRSLPLFEELASEDVDPPFTFHENFSLNDRGELISSKGGQVILTEGRHFDFSPIYQVRDVRPEEIHQVHFPCSVCVKCELSGPLEWNIDGNLTVEEFWSAWNIRVQGDAYAQGGIQTNFPHEEEKKVHIAGDLEANFIQLSAFEVGGNVRVKKAILSSNIKAGGHVECLGNPGKIIGSEICLTSGSVYAKGVGSERDKPAFIKFNTKAGANNSKIDFLAEATRVQVEKKNIIIKDSGVWPPAPQKK